MSLNVSDIGEKQLIKYILDNCEDITGDDAAYTELNDLNLISTCDMLIQSRHFPENMSYEQMGFKAVSVNVSDLAAMGAKPLGFLLAIAFPKDLKLAIGAGIGFFLAFLGFANAGVIVSDPSTIVSLGTLSSAPVLLSLIGVVITLILYVRKVPAAVFIGLVITAILGVIMSLAGLGGVESTLPTLPAQWISFNLDFSVFGGFTTGFGELFSNIPSLIMILFSMLFVAFFDTTGTLIPLAKECGYENEDGTTKGINRAFISDALGGIVGAIFGSSTVTAFVESATGIGLGGRTGLTAIVTGILFILSVFFAPAVLALFTSSVTTAALVIVGILMFIQIKDIEWDNMVIIASVFMTIIMMVLTYSISLGIAFGFCTYVICSVATGKTKELNSLVWILFIVFILYLFFGL